MPPQGGTRRIDPERLKRTAAIYRSANDAAMAIGITPAAYRRACKKQGIPLPGSPRR